MVDARELDPIAGLVGGRLGVAVPGLVLVLALAPVDFAQAVLRQ